MALANLSIYYTWKNINQNTTTLNLKFQDQLGIILLIYQMVLILFQTFKTTLSHALLYLHSPTLRIFKETIVGQILQF